MGGLAKAPVLKQLGTVFALLYVLKQLGTVFALFYVLKQLGIVFALLYFHFHYNSEK